MHKLSDAGRKFSFPIEMASVILAQSRQLTPYPREETSLQIARMRLKKIKEAEEEWKKKEVMVVVMTVVISLGSLGPNIPGQLPILTVS